MRIKVLNAMIFGATLSLAGLASGTAQAGTLAVNEKTGASPLEALLVHCCHAHPLPPYDSYCCHSGGAYYGAAAPYGYAGSVRRQSRRVSRRTSRRVSRRR